ncbi:MAG: alpha/beta fold hydrolase [Anaerolineae bacterium]|nr:alpha/beta fold hydrolase [Anaerolineae bacterium]
MKISRLGFMILLVSIVLSLFLFPVVLSAQDSEIPYGDNEEAGAYAEVNDITLYYEIYGEGEPVLVLHGNGASIAANAYQIEALKEHFQVIAVDTRAQGKSTDSDQPLSYVLFASDMVGLLDVLGLESASVVGWSDGGNTGLAMAINYPDRINKLVTMGANFDPGPDAVYDEVRQIVIAALAMEDLPDDARKLTTILVEQPNYTYAELNSITTPTLITAGDHDLIREEHTIDLYLNIPTAYLMIVPGATHRAPVEKPDLLNSVIVDFLQTPYEDIDRFYFFR